MSTTIDTPSASANSETAVLPRGLPTLRSVPMPSDLNAFGSVFGGWVMAQVDMAGGIAAMRRSEGRVATVSVNSFLFKQPIDAGDLVSFYTEVVKVGKTSVTVSVEVYAERHLYYGKIVKITEAVLTFVAVDAVGTKRLLPPETPQNSPPVEHG